MDKLRVRGAGAALGLLLCCYVAARAEVRGDESAAFRLVAGGLVVVPVRLGGAGPFDFLLDTGANTTLVHGELAARLGLRASGRLRLLTVAGERDVPRARLPEVSVGGRVARDLEALVCDLGALRALDARVAGVLGQNFLSRFDYTLDYGERRLEFGGGERGGARVPFESHEGRLLVEAGAGRGAGPWRLVLDTAATALVLFGGAGGGAALDLSGAERMTAATNAGSRAVRVARLRRLRVGGESFRDVPVALLPDPAGAAARPEDGLLPASLFRSVHFNHRGGYVVLRK